jgi:hypothetical protein
MRYGELITRSFSIVWRFKYLWLLALLGGADVTSGGGGFSGNIGNVGNLGNPSGGPSGGSTVPGGLTGADAAEAFRQAMDALAQVAGLLVLIGVVVAVLALAWFALSSVTTGALVRASAEHDAERPFGFGMAWRAGVRTFWPMVGLRLLALAYGLVVLAVAAGFVGLGVAAYLNRQDGLLGAVVVFGVLALLVVIVVSIVVGLALILATRAVVLEQRGPLSAVGRGLQLIRRRLGRVLLVWLLQIGLSLAAGIAIVVALIPVVLVGAALIGASAYAGGAPAALAVGIPFGLAALVVLVTIGVAVGAYLSTYWTLAFRRMEVDAPAPAPWPPAAHPTA